MVLDDHAVVGNSRGLTHEHASVVRVVKYVDEQDAVERAVAEWEMGPVEDGDRNVRRRPLEDVNAFDGQVRAALHDVGGNRSVAGSDVENPGVFRKSCRQDFGQHAHPAVKHELPVRCVQYILSARQSTSPISLTKMKGVRAVPLAGKAAFIKQPSYRVAHTTVSRRRPGRIGKDKERRSHIAKDTGR